METALRLSEEEIKLLDELQELGLDYRVRDRWDAFMLKLSDSEKARALQLKVDELQSLLVYHGDHDPIALYDLPWDTLEEMKADHAPEPEPEPKPVEPQPAAEFAEPELSDEAEGALKKMSKDELIEWHNRIQRDIDLATEIATKNDATRSRFSQIELCRNDLNQAKFQVQDNKFDKAKDSLVAVEADTADLLASLRASDSMTPCELKFPFPEPREGQLEAAKETRDQLLKNDAVACAPTGFGKSGYVLSVCSGFKEGAYVITPQRVLVQQYMDDFADVPWVGFLKGRNDFHCECEKAKTKRGPDPKDWPTCGDFGSACPLCRKTARKAGLMGEQGKCPYTTQRDIAMNKPVTVMTAAMAATLMLYRPQAFPRRAVLAIDESQRLEDTLISACTTVLRQSTLKKDGWLFTNPIKEDDDGLGTLVWPNEEQGENAVKAWLKIWLQRADRRLEKLERSIEDASDKDRREFKKYTGYVSSLNMAFRFTDPSQPAHRQRPHVWLHTQENERFKVPEAFEVKPLSAIGLLDDIAGDAATRKLLVSATPGSPAMIQGTLGLKCEPTYLDYGSPFPVANRKTVVMPVVSLKYGSSDKDFKTAMDAITMIAGAELGGRRDHAKQKGIIHTVSNQLHDRIKKALQTAGMGWRIREVRGSYRRIETIEEFQVSEEPLIMMGPALTDGVSLKDDQCRWGIIPKLPWPPFKEPTVEFRKSHIHDWYPYQVVLSIIQATGRNVRSKDDWATNYILDSGLGSLVNRNRDLFPEWWIDGLEFM